MNHRYRLVFNAALNAWVAVSEIARGRGKGSGGRRGGRSGAHLLGCLLAGALAPQAHAADCFAADAVDLGNCISNAVPGDNIVLTASFALPASLPAVAGNVTLVNNGFSLTGGAALNKDGAAQLSLTGNNAYSGGTTISSGVLAIGSGGALGTGPVNIGSGGELRANNSMTLTTGALNFNAGGGRISAATGTTLNYDAGGFNASVAGNLVFGSTGSAGTVVLSVTGGSVNAGGTTLQVAGGTLRDGNGRLGAFTASDTLTVDANAVYDMNNSATTMNNLQGAGTVTTGSTPGVNLTVNNGNFSGTIQGGGNLVKSNTGTFIVSNLNLSGNITINGGGTLQVGNGGAASITTSAISNDGALVFDNSGTVAVNAAMLGTGTLVKNGNGTVQLNGAASHSGDTTVNAGTLAAGADGVLSNFSNVALGAAGATLNLNGFAQGINALSGVAGSAVVLGNGGNLTLGTNFGNSNFAGNIFGSGTVTFNGIGTQVLSGASNYTGTTNVARGTLQAGAANAFAGGSDFTIANSTTLDLNGHDNTIGSLTGGAGANVNLGGARLTAGGANDSTFSGLIMDNGGGGLTKAGTGTLTLNGFTNYSGGTRVVAGTLALGSSNALGGGVLAFGGGGLRANTTLALSNDVAIDAGITAGIAAAVGSTLTLSGGSFALGSGASATFGEISQTGTVVLATAATTLDASNSLTIAGGTLELRNDAGIAAAVTNNGTLRFAGTGATLVSGAIGGSGDLAVQSGTVTLTGANNHTGTTTIAGGTLRVGDGNNTGTLGSGQVNNNGSLVFERNGSVTIANLIQGNGSVTQAGSGITTLTGNNSYTGQTTLSGGTLRVGDGNTTGTLGSGQVTNNAALVFERSDSVNAANLIQGSGSVTQAGTGNLTLAAGNTYSGGTTLTAGTLTAAGNDALGTGDITLGGAKLALAAPVTSLGAANLSVNAGQAATLAVADGGFVSTSTRLATNANSTLVVGSSTERGRLAWNLDLGSSIDTSSRLRVAGGTLASASVQFGGVLENFRSVSVDAGATLQLNSLAYMTSLDGAGTVSLSGAGARVRESSGGSSFSGIIEGTGVFEKGMSNNTFVLTGENRSTGGTRVSQGTLQVGDGGTTGSLGTGPIQIQSGSLAFNHSDSTTLANEISGSGTLRQAGGGKLILTGNTAAFTGTVEASAGTLSVNGILGGSVNVLNGGTLGGSGTVGTTNVMSGGVVAPGNSIGTLTVNGNLTFAPGSIYRVETDAAGNADRVNVVGAPGTLTINGGTVDVQAGAGSYKRNTLYTILTSTGGRTGTFAGASSNLAFLTPTLSYDAGNVYLNLQSGNAPADYASVAVTRNQKSVANYLNGFANNPGDAGDTGVVALIQQVDNLTADQARSAFDSLSGSQHAAASQVAAALGRGFSGALGARTGAATGGDTSLAAAFTATRYATLPAATASDAGAGASPGAANPGGLWAQALGSGGRSAGDGNGPDSSYRANGFVLGLDRALGEQWLAGGAVSYGRTTWDAGTRGASPASGKIESPQAGLYARYLSGPWQLKLEGSYADHGFDTRRTVTVGNATSIASSSHHGTEWAAGAEIAYTVNHGDWQLQPLAGLRHARLSEDGFTETGAAGANLAVEARRTQNTIASAGVKLVRALAGTGRVELRAIASHLVGDNDSPVTSRLAGQAASFTSNGTPLKRTALTLGATASGQISRKLTGYVDAAYEHRGSGQSAFQLAAGLKMAW